MNDHLNQALVLFRSLNAADIAMAKPTIDKILRLKIEIENHAETFGYPNCCRKSIADCRGNCCRWHFPRNLDVVDFFLSIWGLGSKRRQDLILLFKNRGDNIYYCPLLQADGCFFSFNDRPIQCTMAYPCFAQTDYRTYTSHQYAVITQLKNSLGNLLYGVEK